MKRILTVLSMVSILLASTALFAEDGDAKGQKQTVYALDNSDWPTAPSVFVPISGDWSRITRLPDRIKVEVRLTDLNPDQVYNAHLWIFNNPAACLGSSSANARGNACSALVDQFVPETLPSLVSFGGFIPNSSGNLHLELELRISEGLPAVSFFETNGSFVNAVLPPGGVSVGLIDPMNADVSFDLARKGPIQPENTQLQFKTMFGACGPDFSLPPLDPDQLCEIVRESPVGGTLF